MFDNPKKELERLEQQLLAAEMDIDEEVEEEFDDLYEDIYDEFGEEAPYDVDDELESLLNGTELPIRNYSNNYGAPERELYDRAAGFDTEIEEEEYHMDESRYAAPPKKKGFRGLVIFTLLQAIVIIALALWWLGQQL